MLLRIFNGNVILFKHNSVPALPLRPQETLEKQCLGKGTSSHCPDHPKGSCFTVTDIPRLGTLGLFLKGGLGVVWWLGKPRQPAYFFLTLLSTP